MERHLKEFEELSKGVHKSLECAICLEILDQPYSTSCNHQFCRKCLEQLMSRKKKKSDVKCPLCNEKISKRGLSENVKLGGIVDAVRGVLDSLEEDLLTVGSDAITKTTKRNNKNCDKIGPNKDDGESMKMIVYEPSNKKQLRNKGSNRGGSRNMRWAEKKTEENHQTVNNTAGVLEALESGSLGRRKRRPKIASEKSSSRSCDTKRNEDLDKRSLPNDTDDVFLGTEADLPHPDEEPLPAEKENQAAANANQSTFNGTAKKSVATKIDEMLPTEQVFVVPETPLLPRPGEANNIETPEVVVMSREDVKPVKNAPKKKKTSPFAGVNGKKVAQEEPPSSCFDFVEDDADLYERIKCRTRKVDSAQSNESSDKGGQGNCGKSKSDTAIKGKAGISKGKSETKSKSSLIINGDVTKNVVGKRSKSKQKPRLKHQSAVIEYGASCPLSQRIDSDNTETDQVVTMQEVAGCVDEVSQPTATANETIYIPDTNDFASEVEMGTIEDFVVVETVAKQEVLTKNTEDIICESKTGRVQDRSHVGNDPEKHLNDSDVFARKNESGKATKVVQFNKDRSTKTTEKSSDDANSFVRVQENRDFATEKINVEKANEIVISDSEVDLETEYKKGKTVGNIQTEEVGNRGKDVEEDKRGIDNEDEVACELERGKSDVLNDKSELKNKRAQKMDRVIDKIVSSKTEKDDIVEAIKNGTENNDKVSSEKVGKKAAVVDQFEHGEEKLPAESADKSIFDEETLKGKEDKGATTFRSATGAANDVREVDRELEDDETRGKDVLKAETGKAKREKMKNTVNDSRARKGKDKSKVVDDIGIRKEISDKAVGRTSTRQLRGTSTRQLSKSNNVLEKGKLDGGDEDENEIKFGRPKKNDNSNIKKVDEQPERIVESSNKTNEAYLESRMEASAVKVGATSVSSDRICSDIEANNVSSSRNSDKIEFVKNNQYIANTDMANARKMNVCNRKEVRNAEVQNVDAIEQTEGKHKEESDTGKQVAENIQNGSKSENNTDRDASINEDATGATMPSEDIQSPDEALNRSQSSTNCMKERISETADDTSRPAVSGTSFKEEEIVPASMSSCSESAYKVIDPMAYKAPDATGIIETNADGKERLKQSKAEGFKRNGLKKNTGQKNVAHSSNRKERNNVACKNQAELHSNNINGNVPELQEPNLAVGEKSSKTPRSEETLFSTTSTSNDSSSDISSRDGDTTATLETCNSADLFGSRETTQIGTNEVAAYVEGVKVTNQKRKDASTKLLSKADEIILEDISLNQFNPPEKILQGAVRDDLTCDVIEKHHSIPDWANGIPDRDHSIPDRVPSIDDRISSSVSQLSQVSVSLLAEGPSSSETGGNDHQSPSVLNTTTTHPDRGLAALSKNVTRRIPKERRNKNSSDRLGINVQLPKTDSQYRPSQKPNSQVGKFANVAFNKVLDSDYKVMENEDCLLCAGCQRSIQRKPLEALNVIEKALRNVNESERNSRIHAMNRNSTGKFNFNFASNVDNRRVKSLGGNITNSNQVELSAIRIKDEVPIRISRVKGVPYIERESSEIRNEEVEERDSEYEELGSKRRCLKRNGRNTKKQKKSLALQLRSEDFDLGSSPKLSGNSVDSKNRNDKQEEPLENEKECSSSELKVNRKRERNQGAFDINVHTSEESANVNVKGKQDSLEKDSKDTTSSEMKISKKKIKRRTNNSGDICDSADAINVSFKLAGSREMVGTKDSASSAVNVNIRKQETRVKGGSMHDSASSTNIKSKLDVSAQLSGSEVKSDSLHARASKRSPTIKKEIDSLNVKLKKGTANEEIPIETECAYSSVKTSKLLEVEDNVDIDSQENIAVNSQQDKENQAIKDEIEKSDLRVTRNSQRSETESCISSSSLLFFSDKNDSQLTKTFSTPLVNDSICLEGSFAQNTPSNSTMVKELSDAFREAESNLDIIPQTPPTKPKSRNISLIAKSVLSQTSVYENKVASKGKINQSRLDHDARHQTSIVKDNIPAGNANEETRSEAAFDDENDTSKNPSMHLKRSKKTNAPHGEISDIGKRKSAEKKTASSPRDSLDVAEVDGKMGSGNRSPLLQPNELQKNTYNDVKGNSTTSPKGDQGQNNKLNSRKRKQNTNIFNLAKKNKLTEKSIIGNKLDSKSFQVTETFVDLSSPCDQGMKALHDSRRACDPNELVDKEDVIELNGIERNPNYSLPLFEGSCDEDVDLFGDIDSDCEAEREGKGGKICKSPKNLEGNVGKGNPMAPTAPSNDDYGTDGSSTDSLETEKFQEPQLGDDDSIGQIEFGTSPCDSLYTAQRTYDGEVVLFAGNEDDGVEKTERVETLRDNNSQDETLKDSPRDNNLQDVTLTEDQFDSKVEEIENGVVEAAGNCATPAKYSEGEVDSMDVKSSNQRVSETKKNKAENLNLRKRKGNDSSQPNYFKTGPNDSLFPVVGTYEGDAVADADDSVFHAEENDEDDVISFDNMENECVRESECSQSESCYAAIDVDETDDANQRVYIDSNENDDAFNSRLKSRRIDKKQDICDFVNEHLDNGAEETRLNVNKGERRKRVGCIIEDDDDDDDDDINVEHKPKRMKAHNDVMNVKCAKDRGENTIEYNKKIISQKDPHLTKNRFENEKELFASGDSAFEREILTENDEGCDDITDDFEREAKPVTKSVSLFKNLVEKAKKMEEEESERKADDSDENEDLMMKPSFRIPADESTKTKHATNKQVVVPVNTEKNTNKQDQELIEDDDKDDFSPPSPTPPPKLATTKKASPLLDTTLNDMKKLLQNDTLGYEDLHFQDVRNTKEIEKPGGESCGKANTVSAMNPEIGGTNKKLTVRSEDNNNRILGKPNQNIIKPHSAVLVDRPADRNVISTPPQRKLKSPVKESQKEVLKTPILNAESRKRNMLKNQENVVGSEMTIIPSRLKRKEMSYCKAMADKMGGRFSTVYIPGSTHLVMGTDENLAIDRTAYTYKYLMALITGSWIVSFKWIIACLKAGKLIGEENFEVKGDPLSNQEMIPHLARISKKKHKAPLFKQLTLSLMGNFQSSQINKEQLIQILKICGAKVIFQIPTAIPEKNYLLITDLESLEDGLTDRCLESNIQPVHFEWIMESIINYKVQDPTPFLLNV